MLMNIRDEDIAGMIRLIGATAQTSHASATKLIEIAKALGAGKQFYVSIPDAGGLYSLQAGTTEVNFYEGYIINPDASKVSMRSGLKMQGMTHMRSLMFTTLCDLTMSLDGAGFFDLDAGEKYIISDFDFKEIYISADAPGYIRFVAATTPSMTAMYDRYASYDLEQAIGARAESIYAQDGTKQQQISLDLGEMFSRMVLQARGASDNDVTFKCEESEDAVHWFTADEDTGVEYSFGGANTFRYVRLTSSASGVAGNKVSLILKAAR
jgi:hypothetical protein